MTSPSKSADSDPLEVAANLGAPPVASHDWLKVGAFAAASAVLGGLAAAWFYRKTLSQLREAENEIPDAVAVTAPGREEDF